MFDRRAYFVREHVGMMKIAGVYDVLDASTGEMLGVAREDVPWQKALLRMIVDKRMLPNTVLVGPGPDAPPRLVIHKGFTLFRSRLEVKDGSGKVLGRFASKLLTLGGGFLVEDESGRPLADVKGDWKGWNFRFESPEGRLLGTFSRKWGGLAKELFTTADSYVVALEPEAASLPHAAELLLAAALAIDVVYKER